MPLIKSAKKKLKQDKKRTQINKRYEVAMTKAFKNLKAKKGDTSKLLKVFYSSVDKALKKNIIHKKKAARLKSQAAKLLGRQKSKRQAIKKSK